MIDTARTSESQVSVRLCAGHRLTLKTRDHMMGL